MQSKYYKQMQWQRNNKSKWNKYHNTWQVLNREKYILYKQRYYFKKYKAILDCMIKLGIIPAICSNKKVKINARNIARKYYKLDNNDFTTLTTIQLPR